MRTIIGVILYNLRERLFDIFLLLCVIAEVISIGMFLTANLAGALLMSVVAFIFGFIWWVKEVSDDSTGKDV